MSQSGATDAERIEDLIEQLDELSLNMAVIMAENEILTRVVTSDATLQGAVDEIKKLNREVIVLKERNDGLMHEKNAAIREAQSARKTVKA